MALSDVLRAKGFAENPRPNSKVGQALAARGVSMTAELARILALPRRTLDLSSTSTEYRHTAKCLGGCVLCQKDPPVLWPIQAAMLREAKRQRGLFAAVGVGWGKTLVSLLLHVALEATKTVLLIRPALREQLLVNMAPLYRRHFVVPKIHREPGQGPGLYVMAYSELSTASRADWLEQIEPDLIVADEAHELRHKSSARTKRWTRYMKLHEGTMFAGLSGTMTTRSIVDYGHLIEAALRKNSPLPNKFSDLRDWSAALDDGVLVPMAPGKLRLFCEEGESTRSGFQRRNADTLGAVYTTESAIGTSLTIKRVRPIVPAAVHNAIAKLENTWAWGDEELEDPMAIARVARQLACGFAYRWDWAQVGGRDEEWIAARKAWHAELRNFLRYRSGPGLDSPLLVASAAAAGRWDSVAWPAWAKVKDRPMPPVVTDWISKFAVVEAVQWAATIQVDGRRGIIWYQHDALGQEIARVGGLPLFGAGSGAALSALDQVSGPRVIVCSIEAHKTGRELQGFDANLVTTPPANGAAWEQLIARTHRPGQKADVVTVEIWTHTTAFRASLDSAISSAAYEEETTGQKQKLLYAEWL